LRDIHDQSGILGGGFRVLLQNAGLARLVAQEQAEALVAVGSCRVDLPDRAVVDENPGLPGARQLLARFQLFAVKPYPDQPVSREKPRGRPGRCRRRTVTWCRRATSSSSSEARLRTRNESREQTADRSAYMPTTVWARHKKRYTSSAGLTFEQAQVAQSPQVCNATFRQMFTSQFAPDATNEQADWFNELQRISCSPKTAVRTLKVFGDLDVTDLLDKVSMPTLVMHARE
jgi:hypothetical protein